MRTPAAGDPQNINRRSVEPMPPRFNDYQNSLEASMALYVNAGHAVFAVFGVGDGGECLCGNPACESVGKHPMTPNGYKDATRDPTVMLRWFREHPKMNLGVRTSSKLAILDIDPRNGGLESFDKLRARTGADIWQTPATVQTGGRGWHLGFVAEAGTRSRNGILPGLDLKAEGGYVVAPPSRHKSGGSYVRIDGFSLKDLPPLPSVLLEAIAPKPTSAKVDGIIAPGQRNTALTSIAGTIRRAGGGPEQILQALRVVNSNMCATPLSDAEVGRIATSVGKYDTGPYPTIPFIGAAQLVATQQVSMEWILHGLIAKGVITEFLGAPKAGKSTFVLSGIAAIVRGSAFLGHHARRAKVVLLTEEHSISLTRALTRHGIASDDLIIVQRGQVRDAKWGDVIAATVAEAARVGAELIVVDTLPAWSLEGTDENSASDAIAAMRPLTEAAATGIAVVVIRHQRKSGGDVTSAGRGSSAYAGQSDIVVTMKEYGGRPTLRVLESKSRFEETPAKLVVDWTGTGFVSHGDGAALSHLAVEDSILDILPWTHADARDMEAILAALKNSKNPVGRSTAKKRIDALVARKEVAVMGQGSSNDPQRYYRIGQPTP